MKLLQVGLLTYTAAPRLSTTMSLALSVPHLAKANIGVTFSGRHGDGIIPRARNSLCAEFLKSNADYLLFLDDDIGWKPEQLAKFISHPVDIVAGAYRYKTDEELYPVRPLNNEIWAANGLWEVEMVPGGFLRLSRACVERMFKAYPQFEYHDPATNGQSVGIFNYEIADGVWWGEDFTFYRRWRAIGGQIWIDPELTLEHTGPKTFTGCIGDWVKNLPPDKFIR